MHLDDRLHSVALRVRSRQVNRPPRRDVVDLEAVSCRTHPRECEGKAPLLMRSEPEIDRFIRRLKHGNGRGIDGIFAVGKPEGNALRLFEDKRQGVRAARVSWGAPES